MNKWQELVREHFTRDEPDLAGLILRKFDRIDDPADAVVCLYQLIRKIDQLADAIDEVAARETRIQLAQAEGLGAVTGEL